MTSFIKKISALMILAAALPAAALAADVNFQLQISPPSSIGITGYSGGGGAVEPANPPAAPQTNAVSGWTSPNAFVEIISGNRILGTVTAKNDGSFSINSLAPSAGPLIVRSTDAKNGLTTETPLATPGSAGATVGVVLPPTLSLPSTVSPSGTIAGTGKTVPGGTISIILTDQNGKTLAQMPTVDNDGNFTFSFSAKGLSAGAITLQVSLNYNGKTAVNIIKGMIGRPTPFKPTNMNQPFAPPAKNIPVNGNAPVITPPSNNQIPITWFRPKPANPVPIKTESKAKNTHFGGIENAVKTGASALLAILAIFFCFKCFSFFKNKK